MTNKIKMPVFFLFVMLCSAHSADKSAEAWEIFRAARITNERGIIVHIGTGDGSLTSSLHLDAKFLVHGLEPDAKNLSATNKAILDGGMYGLISAQKANLSSLPYIENLITLIVVNDLDRMLSSGMSLKEIYRVLAPRGVAMLSPVTDEAAITSLCKAGGIDTEHNLNFVTVLDKKWARIYKARPASHDEWTHFRHGPDNNAVSSDMAVGGARRLKWTQDATWEGGRTSAPVSANGRIFYKCTVFNPATGFTNSSTYLHCRDSYSGLLLWYADGTPHAAEGDIVYAQRGTSSKKQLVAIDAVTGKDIRTYQNAAWFRYSPMGPVVDGIMYNGDGKAIDMGTDKVIWTAENFPPVYSTGARMAVSGDRIFALQHEKRPDKISDAQYAANKLTVSCYNKATGKQLWQTDTRSHFEKQYGSYPSWADIVVYKDVVAVEGNESVIILSASDGSVLWDEIYNAGYRHSEHSWALFADNSLWLAGGSAKPAPGEREPEKDGRWKDWQSFNILSGAMGKSLSPGYEVSTGRCAPSIGCGRGFIGAEGNFIDRATSNVVLNEIGRNACNIGTRHANGMIYTFPHHCTCYAMVRGFLAYASESELRADTARVPDANRLEKGEAFGTALTSAGSGGNDWPYFRHDASRSAKTSMAVSGGNKLWQINLVDRPPSTIAEDWKSNKYINGALGSPVVAGDMVIVAAPDAHQIIALKTQNAEIIWRFFADARTVTSPTIYKGLVLFGCQDGRVYCLRASDGKLAWRFLAAPREELIMPYGQLESQWPILGGIIVENDVAVCAAGHKSNQLGGLNIWGINVKTGSIVWQNGIDDYTIRKTGQKYYNRPLADLLVKVGGSVAVNNMLTFNPANGDIAHATGFSPHSGLKTEATLKNFGTILLDWQRCSEEMGGSTIRTKPRYSGSARASISTGSGTVTAKHSGVSGGSISGAGISSALPSAPAFEGIAAGDGKVFISCQDGELVCFGSGTGPGDITSTLQSSAQAPLTSATKLIATNAVQSNAPASMPAGYSAFSAGAIPGQPSFQLTPSSDNSAKSLPAAPLASDLDITRYLLPRKRGAILRQAWQKPLGDELPIQQWQQRIDENAPEHLDMLTSLDYRSEGSEAAVSIIRGYVHPPQDGYYSFHLAAGAQAQLYLSSDDDPAHKTLIASTSAPTGYQEWSLERLQDSELQDLNAAGRYYIEIRLANTGQNNHLSVAWDKPDGTFEIVAGDNLAPFLLGSGGIVREYWAGIDGKRIDDLVTNSYFPNAPSGKEVLPQFSTRLNWADNYGERIHGYIHPPVSGEYRIRLAGNGACRLLLSPDDNPENAELSCEIAVASDSGPVPAEAKTYQLVGGRKYYIALLHKEDSGSDQVSISWQVPGSDNWQVIGGQHLSPIAK